MENSKTVNYNIKIMSLTELRALGYQLMQERDLVLQNLQLLNQEIQLRMSEENTPMEPPVEEVATEPVVEPVTETPAA